MAMKVKEGVAPRLLNEFEVAEHLGLAVGTLRRWRQIRSGPKWVKLGSAVRYRQEDLQAYVDGSAV
jgi:predicted DNA-binding transcriptional regulator AlpA